MKRISVYIIFALLLIVACSPIAEAAIVETEIEAPQNVEIAEEQVAADQSISIIDGLGREIHLNAPATSIVALGPSSLESLFAIGAGDQIVGREEYSSYPEEALEIPSIGNLFTELPIEAILALEPDLVIAPQIVSPENVQRLIDLGLTVFWQANPSDFNGLFENIIDLAQLTGHEEEAEALIVSLASRVRAVKDVTSYAEHTPLVFYELDATDPENPYTIGAGVFIDTIISLAGGKNIGAVLNGDYAQMSSEEVILQNPEVILLADALYGVSPEIVSARSGWEGIDAVVNGQVLPFDPFLVSVPGPRMVEGLESMALLLHPDLFE